MKSVNPTNSLLNPRRASAFRTLRTGDLFNAVIPAIEAAGFEVEQICEEGFLVRASRSDSIVGEFHTRNTVVPPAGEPADDDQVVPLSDPSWSEDDGFWEPNGDDDTFPGREFTRTADTTLSPEEEQWKERLAPFSRNDLDADTLIRVRRALRSYDDARRIL
jgi:hypothetical protein